MSDDIAFNPWARGSGYASRHADGKTITTTLAVTQGVKITRADVDETGLLLVLTFEVDHAIYQNGVGDG